MSRVSQALFAIIVAAFLAASAVAFFAPSAATQPALELVDVSQLTRSNWSRLNPSGTAPRNGFKAFYFDRTNTGRAAVEETVHSVAIKYAWADFNRIDSPDFAGYWVGVQSFAQPTRKQISVSQSWAKSRILIDGQVVFDAANQEHSFFHDFSAGDHVIEVEYSNNWHTVEYKVTIDDVFTPWAPEDLSGYFQRSSLADAKLYYAGVYESDARDTGVNVSLPRTGSPVILWLSSHEAVDWKIDSADPIEAIVLGSNAPGSRVFGAQPRSLFRLSHGPEVHTETRECSCTRGYFRCEHDADLTGLAQQLQAITGHTLAGYATQYSAADLAMTSYDTGATRRIAASRTANQQAEMACSNNANQNFDSSPDWGED